MLNDLYQSLDPIAFSCGPITVRWYGLAYLAGFVLAGFVMWGVGRRWKLRLSGEDVVSLLACVALGLIIGARLFYAVFYNPARYLSDPVRIFFLNEGGMSFHGGLLGALLGGLIGCKLQGFSFLTVADLACVGAPCGLFFGRVANFVNGELWGKPCDLPWAVCFESGGSIPRHPSQLYEAILEGILLFALLYALSRRVPPRPKGTFIGVFLVGYAVSRILVEFVRVPDAQLGYLFSFVTMGQLLSLPVLVAGIAVLVWSRKKKTPQSLRPLPRADAAG